jgi:hypothetical protein
MRLAFVAGNALANGDVTRAAAALSELNQTLTGFDVDGDAQTPDEPSASGLRDSPAHLTSYPGALARRES